MSRYEFTGIKVDKDTGNRVLKPTLYPEIKVEDGDQFIYPIDGDRFETLAFRYYGDTSLWWVIARANDVRDGSYSLQPDEKIRIPSNIPQLISEDV